MYRKLAALAAIVLTALLGFYPSLVTAKEIDQEIPEKDGVYEVARHPGLKVRVIVHHPKSEKTTSLLSTCTVSDPSSNAAVSPAGWHLPGGPWAYSLNLNSVPLSVGAANLPILANAAFSQWSNAVGGNKIIFTRGTDSNTSRASFDGKNDIFWGRTSRSALAITYTWYYSFGPQAGTVAEVDTVMNKIYPWTWVAYSPTACVNSNTYDAEDILTHELGHWMGLDDEYTSDYINNTMYGYGAKGEIKKDTLTAGDIAPLSTIYH